MIYIITDNYFLFNGVKHAMYPISVMQNPITLANKHDLFCDGDLVLIDDNISLRGEAQSYIFNEKRIVIVFLNTIRNASVDFMRIHSSYRALDRHISIKDFRINMLRAVTKKDPVPIKNHKKILTQREHQILLASINGRTIQEIATATGLKDKTIYHHRKNACLKLGVARYIDVAPFRSSLMAAASLLNTEVIHGLTECVLN